MRASIWPLKANYKQMKISERVYEWITDEGEVRACANISEDACRETPSNFFKNVSSGALSKLAGQLVSPGTTLPWVLAAMGVPAAFSGALVPIKDAGSLLPQLVVSAKIRSFPKRKWFWIIPAWIQALALLAMAFVVWNLDGIVGGWLVLACLALFSISSGVASISFKDVTAKTIPKGKRGQLLAMRATSGGILTLLVGVLILADFFKNSDREFLFMLVLSGAVLWALSGFLFSLIHEEAGATSGGRTPVQEIKKAWVFWQEDQNLRKFIFTRGLLMAIPLAQPFFVLLGRSEIGEEVSNLGIMVLAAGIGSVISSPFWGRFADRSSKKLMIAIALLGMVNIALMALFPLWPESFQNSYSFAVLFLIQVMAHGGARLSRKTYLVDFAPEKDRPSYVSLSNTAIGLFTLVGAGLGSLASIFGISPMLWIFSALLLVAAILGSQLDEVQD
ncbi:MFS transporter [Cyclobacterium jeungdonense]|uniref:MFS transporter n=2 Tax=Cyclobacterium jeungdonense TaxID=708087 RepID=A0ABT8C823_9BACT|nr:MFS transporter [Cyclobacterium jeungdonense]MDN3688930.1 MFS transporter [Cyclobacterium jeungdonense]